MGASRKTLPDLIDRLIAHWPDELSGQCAFEVGLSGGIDSVVLLDLLVRLCLERGLKLSAVHVHHGLSPQADAWAEHCRQLCLEWGVPLRSEAVKVEVSGGESLEAVARQHRYRVYGESSASVVVLAHHQDDQAETVLLQLLRGAGPKGVAAMPTLRRHAGRWLWRPLLAISRAEIEAYARWRQLVWVEDESNVDTRWRRNLLRHDILPLIESAIPHYRQHLQRAAVLMADASAVLDEQAEQDLQRCRDAGRLLVQPLSSLSPPRQRNMLQYWLERLGLGVASPEALEQFRHQVLHAAPDRNPELLLPQGRVFRYRGALWPLAVAMAPQTTRLAAGVLGARVVPRSWPGELGFVLRSGGLDPLCLQGGFELRVRVGGERLAQQVGRKPVKTLLQEAGIPPALRAQWPLLFLPDGRLVAIPGVAVSEGVKLHDGPGWWPEWWPCSLPGS
ncbi:tRNA lysidine(34) synthetase TilS [Pseudogulbenkiania ferrooxidans]|uniref:tRNA(Ile)-lysidine synthase n=1 Tax=Pseudogulbenkiania ferrooxidans 2002 TaxID=279714 RepID=B9Z2M3_9NEIS|nr:tRNA lysidine(34) synthetase TilS [Pseudogulbenkiania ferrooxidans]EEG08826.1 tRNA(Ile)-lysidine synthetase [Pseudogulbenkiania ferrooxidans 2002]